jgi:hypothetical protein
MRFGQPARDALPIMHHLMPLVIGIVLLLN